MNKTLNRIGLFALTLSAVFILGASCSKSGTTAVDTRAPQVAQALTDAGVKFYGAFWCPHCEEQKAMFGEAVDKLPYIECSTPDKQGQTQVCIDAGIKAYPTWEFQDKTRSEGVLTIDQLIQRANLKLASTSQPGPIQTSQ